MLRKTTICLLLAVITSILHAADQPASPALDRWLFNRDLAAFASERPEWTACYKALRTNDAPAAEKALADFFDKALESEDPTYAKFHLGFAYAPAELITRLLPRNTARGLIQRLIARYPQERAAPLRQSLQFAIAEVEWAYGDLDAAVRELSPPRFVVAATDRAELETSIISMSSSLIERGRPDLATNLCAIHFGDLTKPTLRHATNWYHFLHFAHLQNYAGTLEKKIAMIEQLRKDNSAGYGAGHSSITGALFEAYRKQKAPLRTAQVVAEDKKHIQAGRLKVSAEDLKLLDDYIEVLKEQGYLDDNLNPQIPPRDPPRADPQQTTEPGTFKCA